MDQEKLVGTIPSQSFQIVSMPWQGLEGVYFTLLIGVTSASNPVGTLIRKASV